MRTRYALEMRVRNGKNHICCINRTQGVLCFKSPLCLLAISPLLSLANGHVMLHEDGHLLEKITPG
jgi:hypothetical protein